MSIDKEEGGEAIVGISWDSITLRAMPAALIESRLAAGLDFTLEYLSLGEVERTKSRDSEQDAEVAAEDLESRYWWCEEGEQGQRIQAIIRGVDPANEMAVLEAWEKHLKTALKFPFQARVTENQDYPPPCEGDKVEVGPIMETDDLYGVQVQVRHGGKDVVFPLCDLTVLKRKDPNYQPVNDYCVWFANR